MSYLPPPRAGSSPRSQYTNRYATEQPGHHVTHTTAPTLGQYFRSDTRDIPGRKPPKWAGRAAFWLGMLALGMFLWDLFVYGYGTIVTQIAAPIAFVAILFSLIAIIARVGRGLGIFGLIFALAASPVFWSWLARSFF